MTKKIDDKNKKQVCEPVQDDEVIVPQTEEVQAEAADSEKTEDAAMEEKEDQLAVEDEASLKTDVKKKSNKKNRYILNALLIVCAAVIIYCGIRIFGIYGEYGKGNKVNEALASFVQPNETIDSNGNAVQNINVDFEELFAINKDICAWIYLQDSPIDYAVVQGKDNSYYLDHSVTNEKQSYGAIYVDMNNAPGFVDDNTIIYGHRMNNGAMFAELLKYEKQSFYDSHQTMILATPQGNYLLEVFSARIIAADIENYPLNFGSEESFTKFVNIVKEQSFVQTDVAVSAGDKLVMLSTCIKADDSKRFVVHAKITPM